MPQQRSVLDEVVGELAERSGPRRWFHRVAPEHLETLKELREAWLAGRLGKARRPAARVIARILKARGIATVGEQGVEEWLERA